MGPTHPKGHKFFFSKRFSKKLWSMVIPIELAWDRISPLSGGWIIFCQLGQQKNNTCRAKRKGTRNTFVPATRQKQRTPHSPDTSPQGTEEKTLPSNRLPSHGSLTWHHRIFYFITTPYCFRSKSRLNPGLQFFHHSTSIIIQYSLPFLSFRVSPSPNTHPRTHTTKQITLSLSLSRKP